MARKVVRVDSGAEKIARELATREGVSLNEATEVLIKAGQKYLSRSNGKANGKVAKVKGLSKQDEAYVKSWAKRKGVTEDEARTALCVTGILRRRALDKDHAKRTSGGKTPAKRKASPKVKRTSKRKASRKG